MAPTAFHPFGCGQIVNFSKMQNVFVQNAKYICAKCKMSLSKMQHVFVKNAKCVCPNCKMYFSHGSNLASYLWHQQPFTLLCRGQIVCNGRFAADGETFALSHKITFISNNQIPQCQKHWNVQSNMELLAKSTNWFRHHRFSPSLTMTTCMKDCSQQISRKSVIKTLTVKIGGGFFLKFNLRLFNVGSFMIIRFYQKATI